MAKALIAALAGACLLLAGCESKGKYEVQWSFEGDPGPAGPFDCSSRGVDRIQVTFIDDRGVVERQLAFACGPGSSQPRKIRSGTYRVEVQALRPSGQAFVDPQTGETSLLTVIDNVVVGGGGPALVEVTFTPNPKCADGIDNDGDGLVDQSDPGCLDDLGIYDPDPARDEVDTTSPGSIAVSWTISGGIDTCAEVQPGGATEVWVLLDGDEINPAGQFPCDDGQGQITASPGSHQVELVMVDSQSTLARTGERTAAVVAGLATNLPFDFHGSTFSPPQTGTLTFTIAWEQTGQGCTDVTPEVLTQTLRLQTLALQTVDASTFAGTAVDGTPQSAHGCIAVGTLQGLSSTLDATAYTLTVLGESDQSEICWSETFDIVVGIGGNDSLDLVVPFTGFPGTCGI